MNQGLYEFETEEKSKLRLLRTKIAVGLTAGIFLLTSAWSALFPKSNDKQNGKSENSKERSSAIETQQPHEETINTIANQDNTSVASREFIQTSAYQPGTPYFTVTDPSGEITYMKGESTLNALYNIPYETYISYKIDENISTNPQYSHITINYSYILGENGDPVPLPRKSQMEGVDEDFTDSYTEIKAYISYVMQKCPNDYIINWRIEPQFDALERETNSDGTIVYGDDTFEKTNFSNGTTVSYRAVTTPNGQEYTNMRVYTDATLDKQIASLWLDDNGNLISNSNDYSITSTEYYKFDDGVYSMDSYTTFIGGEPVDQCKITPDKGTPKKLNFDQLTQ